MAFSSQAKTGQQIIIIEDAARRRDSTPDGRRFPFSRFYYFLEASPKAVRGWHIFEVRPNVRRLYCAVAAPRLRKTLPGATPAALFAAGAAAVIICAFFLYRHFAPAAAPVIPRDAAETGPAASPAVEAAEGTLKATFGEAYAQGQGGREVFRTTVAVFDGGWAALPVAGLLGGETLTFQADGSAPRPVTAGTWGTGSPVAFWEVDSGYPPQALSLGTWNISLPIDWYAARSADPPLRLEVDAARAAGPFACFPVPPQLRLPGIFVQQGAAVGWTFGEPFDQAYLWTGAPASGPPPEITADRFFPAGSAESREGYYRRLFDSGEETGPAAELEALARGFRRAPLLAPEDVPPELKPAAIVDRMGALADGLLRNGQATEVVRILDDQTIRDSADPVLAGAAILAQAEGQDYNRTMRRLEAIERDVFAVRGLAPRELAEIKSRLIRTGWKIIERELHSAPWPSRGPAGFPRRSRDPPARGGARPVRERPGAGQGDPGVGGLPGGARRLGGPADRPPRRGAGRDRGDRHQFRPQGGRHRGRGRHQRVLYPEVHPGYGRNLRRHPDGHRRGPGDQARRRHPGPCHGDGQRGQDRLRGHPGLDRSRHGQGG